jgi:predicted RNA-binding protein with PUA-like domain
MLEKDIENLIALYPDEFFPKSGFKLVGQQIRLGNKYADIIFKDRVNRKVIIEIKRGILTRDAAGQIMEYYGLLKEANPEEIIELVLCANIIPHERKRFLEISGIECKELGLGLINKIANKYSYEFIQSSKKLNSNKRTEIPKSDMEWIFQANPQRYDIIKALSDYEIGDVIHWQVNQHKTKIKKGHLGIIWMSGKEAGIYAITEILSEPKIMKQFDSGKKYWTDSSDKEDNSKLRVKMKIINNLLNNPVSKENIKKTKGLESLSILRYYQGTNFPVTYDEWQLIKQMIK